MRALRIFLGVVLAGIAALFLISAADSWAWDSGNPRLAAALGVMIGIGAILLLEPRD
jgi:hypothetical protein